MTLRQTGEGKSSLLPMAIFFKRCPESGALNGVSYSSDGSREVLAVAKDKVKLYGQKYELFSLFST